MEADGWDVDGGLAADGSGSEDELEIRDRILLNIKNSLDKAKKKDGHDEKRSSVDEERSRERKRRHFKEKERGTYRSPERDGSRGGDDRPQDRSRDKDRGGSSGGRSRDHHQASSSSHRHHSSSSRDESAKKRSRSRDRDRKKTVDVSRDHSTSGRSSSAAARSASATRTRTLSPAPAVLPSPPREQREPRVKTLCNPDGPRTTNTDTDTKNSIAQNQAAASFRALREAGISVHSRRTALPSPALVEQLRAINRGETPSHPHLLAYAPGLAATVPGLSTAIASATAPAAKNKFAALCAQINSTAPVAASTNSTDEPSMGSW